MAETANQTLYANELIKTFERRTAMLEPRVTTEGIPSGSSFTFLVNGSGDRTATTRGTNGRILAGANADTQVSCTLTEYHDKAEITRFNIFAGQAGAARRSALQEETIAVLNRTADDLVIDALETSTQYAGTTATTLSVEKALHAITVVRNANALITANDVTGLLSPAALAYLLQNDMVSSKDFVEMGPLSNMPLSLKWAGITWMTHTALPGNGGASERLFVFHRSAVGMARDRSALNVAAGYNEEEDYYFARASMFMGAALLQNTGVCSIRHDGSAFAATA